MWKTVSAVVCCAASLNALTYTHTHTHRHVCLQACRPAWHHPLAQEACRGRPSQVDQVDHPLVGQEGRPQWACRGQACRLEQQTGRRRRSNEAAAAAAAAGGGRW